MDQKNIQLPVKPKKAKKKLMDGSGPLSCDPIEGHHLRWVNINDPRDTRNMLWAEGQNYVPVSPKEQNIQKDNYTKEIGGDIRVTGRDGITAVLMKQPIEDYEESLKEISEINNGQVNNPTPRGPHEAIGMFGKTVSMKNYNVKGI